jgi:hypothetical protein
MTVYEGGRNVYGFSVGVLMLQTQFPRIPGDIGNATTWPFPVLFKIVEGATPRRVVFEADPKLIEPFCEGAKELAAAGCKVITTSCGFLAVFQKEVAASVPVPVACSSLIQVPMVARMLAPGQKVGVLTARREQLTERHFNGVGWSSDTTPVVVEGMEGAQAWHASIGGNLPSLDFPAVEAEIAERARQMVERDPSIGALVLECTNMPPYAAAIQRATGRPVFDIITLVTNLASAVQRKPFTGQM